MLKYTKSESKTKRIFELNVGDIFMTGGELFSFVRVKRGGKSIVATSMSKDVDYSIKVNYDSTKDVIGKLIVEKNDSTDNRIKISDVKLNETIVIMTGRGDSVPQLFTLVGITNKAYSHVFQNPVTKKRTQFKSTDNWKVYRINDLIK